MKLDRLLVSDTAHDVHWLFNGHTHSVQYGKQVKSFTGPDADLQAACEYGYCIRHSLDCEGLLDSE